MSKVAWARARIRRERPHLAEYSVEQLLARSKEVRRCAEIAAFMGDDELKELANAKETTND